MVLSSTKILNFYIKPLKIQNDQTSELTSYLGNRRRKQNLFLFWAEMYDLYTSCSIVRIMKSRL
jgi:hypothetical protein